MKHFFLLRFILISTIVVFFPTINTYFSQDDWVFLSHVYKRPWIDVFRYYPEAFYRPIGQQLFFKFGTVLFGLNPIGYHAIALLIHAISIWLLWKVVFGHSGASLRATRLQTPEASATGGQVESPLQLLLIFFYAFHPVHLIALNWLTQIDIEIAALLSLLTILFLEKNFLLSGITFIAALLSHETAAMLPVIMMLKGRSFRTEGPSFRNRWVALFFVAVTILLAKYLMNPFPFQSDYSLGFHPIQLLSTIKWYVLRALFLPEGIRALPLVVQGLSVLSAGLLIFIFRWCLVRALLIFIIGLAPVLLFSQHVFSVYAILPVLWMVLSLGGDFSHPVIPSEAEGSSASVFLNSTRTKQVLISLIIITLSVSSFLTSRSVLPSHWTTTRGEISRRLTQDFLKTERSDLVSARSDLMKFPPGSEPSFASMIGRQFEVLKRDLTE